MIEFSNLSVKRTIKLNPEELKSFEAGIAKEYEAGKIKGPIHLSDGNEEILIDIFSRISNQDFVFSAWRNHYHALLHGVDKNFLRKEILDGKSMGIISNNPNFYSSSIVGGIIPIALGTSMIYKKQKII